MKKLILLLAVVMVWACTENSEVFIPVEKTDVENNLQLLIPTKSEVFTLNNQTRTQLQTPYNVQINVNPSTFFTSTENNDIEYNLNMIELKEYSEFISQGITNTSNISYSSLLYCLYIDAEDEEDKKLDMQVGNTITIRIPSDIAMSNLVVGKGYARENAIEWDYNNQTINQSMEFISWEVNNEDGTTTEYTGYQIELPSTGWFSIATINNQVVNYSDVCVETVDGFESANTLVYLIHEDENFLNRLNETERSSFLCSYNIPIADDNVRLLSISFLNESFYATNQSIDIDDISAGTISLEEPEAISNEDLRSLLESL